MSAFFSSFKVLLLPALSAALLYALFTLLLIPLYRRHKNRYSQYLPIATTSPISSLTSSTSTLRSRVTDALVAFLLPSRWAERRHRSRSSRGTRVVDARDGEDEEMGGGILQDSDIDDEDEINVEGDRRDGLSLSMDARVRSRSAGSGSGGDVDDRRRLGRELEEGFADSSDEEEEEVTPAARRSVQ